MQTANWCIELAIAILGVLGLMLNTRMLTRGFRKDMLAYYTNLSNVLVVLFYLVRCIGRAAGPHSAWFSAVFYSVFLQYAAAAMITLTFIVYHFLLLPTIKKDPEAFGEFGRYLRFSNLCVHYFVPLLTLCNWLFLAEKDGLAWYAPLLFVIMPLVYAACVLLRGASGKNLTDTSSPYPYEFIDPIAIGWKRVGINTCVLLPAIVILGYCIYGLGLLQGLLY